MPKFPSARNLFVGALLIFILSAAFYVRQYTLWLPHWQGDQSQYVTLAVKYDEKGLTDYNLSDVAIRIKSHAYEPNKQLVYPLYLKTGEKGDILRAYELKGLGIYNMPLFYKAPLFPALLSFMHRWIDKLLNPVKTPFLIVKSNLAEQVFKEKPKIFMEAQLWATITPLASSLLIILIIFIFAERMFGAIPALMASAIYAFNPIDIVVSNRVLADTFFSLLVLLSAYIYYYAIEKKRYVGCFFAGVFFGLALLTKQNALLLGPGFLIYTALVAGEKGSWLQRGLKAIFNKHWLLFVITGAFLSFSWYWRVYQMYGTPFYHPGYNNMVSMSMDISSKWFEILESRPHPFILFLIGIPFLCPPMALSLLTLKEFGEGIRSALKNTATDRRFLFLWIWILSFFIFFVSRTESKEHRYLLPVYPALAMLAGYALDKIRRHFREFLVQAYYVDILIILLLAAQAFWAVPMAWDTIFSEKFLILKPF